MTVSSSTSRMSYIGADSTSVFPYSYKIFDQSELLVTVALTSTGVETTLVIATDYTVSGVGTSTGGNVTLVNASQAWLTAGNLKTGYTMSIRRVVPVTQTTSILSNGPYDAKLHEKAFDRGVMRDQQLTDEVNRSLQLPETEAGTAAKTTLPDAATRALKAFIFDASGNPSTGTLTSVGAPLTASYVCMNAQGDLSAERALTSTSQITVTDGGANGNVTLTIPSTAAITAANLTDSALTSGRVVVAGAAGLLADDAALLYDSATNILTAGDAIKITPAAAPGALADGQAWVDSTQKAVATRVQGITEYACRVVYSQATDVTVANTGAATTLMGAATFGTNVMPANYLSSGKTLRFTAWGQFARTGAPALAIGVWRSAPGTVIVNPSVTTVASSYWKFVAEMCVIASGAGATIESMGYLTATGAAGVNPLTSVLSNPSSFDTTAAQTFGIQVLWGAADPANTLTCERVLIEVIG